MRFQLNCKNLLILLLIAGLASCSSSSEKNSVTSKSDVKPESIGVDSKDVKSGESKESSTKVTATSTEVSAEAKMSQLDLAIKNQNDEQIQKWSTEVISQNPKDVKGLNALAMIHYKKNRLDAASYLLNRAMDVQPEKSLLLNNLGLVRLAQGQRREAIKLFRKALEIDSRDPVAGANLGSIYLQEKDYSKANLSLEIAYKGGMRDQKTLNNYAVSLAAVGKGEEAAEIYEKILKDFNNSKEAMLNYSILLIQDLKKPKQGLDLLGRLKFVGAPSEARDLIKDLEIQAKAGLQ